MDAYAIFVSGFATAIVFMALLYFVIEVVLPSRAEDPMRESREREKSRMAYERRYGVKDVE